MASPPRGPLARANGWRDGVLENRGQREPPTGIGIEILVNRKQVRRSRTDQPVDR